jgi:hypothetical protein
MNELDPERPRRQRIQRDLGSGFRVLFFVVGSIFNLLAIVLLIGNIAHLTRMWITNASPALGPELLAPLGAFLAGVLCYLIANAFE